MTRKPASSYTLRMAGCWYSFQYRQAVTGPVSCSLIEATIRPWSPSTCWPSHAVKRVEDGALGTFRRSAELGMHLEQVEPDRADHRVVPQSHRVAAPPDAVRPDELRHPGREVRAVREAVQDVPAVLQVAPDPRRLRESGVRRHDVGVAVEVVRVVHQRRTLRSTRLSRRRITRAGLSTAWPTR